MNKQPSKTNRRRPKSRPGASDIWRLPPDLPELEPIQPAQDPAAMIRSLGDPPMNAGPAAGGYFATVVERTSAMARVIATTFGLMADPDAD